MPGARLPSRAIPAAVIGAGLCAAAIVAMRDPPAKPRASLADDTPRPSGRPHVNDCPMRGGIASVEIARR